MAFISRENHGNFSWSSPSLHHLFRTTFLPRKTVQKEPVKGPGGYTIRIREIPGPGQQQPQPLFVIDGVPPSSTDTLTFVAPVTIQSIVVFKDVLAFIYGTRAVHGVILSLPNTEIPALRRILIPRALCCYRNSINK